MPLFFILSGVFFENSVGARGPVGFFKNKISLIVYPYVLWMLVQGGIEVEMSNYTNGKPVELLDIFTLWVPRAQYWFLFALFMVISTSYFLYRFFGVSGLGGVAILMYFSNIIIDDRYYGFVSGYLIYFFIGIVLCKYEELMKRQAVLMLFLSVFTFSILVIVDINGLFNQLVMAILGSLIVISLSMVASTWRGLDWLSYVGRISMAIYLVHITFGSGFRIISHKFFGIDHTFFHLVFGVLFGLFGSVVFYWCVSKLNIKYVFKFG
jgi:peptidoglycan/LPS O-acetylase OafA/YrhL